jgi:hypothetical protein
VEVLSDVAAEVAKVFSVVEEAKVFSVRVEVLSEATQELITKRHP